MKRAHRSDLFGWSRFDEGRDIDFHSWAWLRSAGAVVVDPLPISDHDREQLGAVSHVIVTNSDHLRAARRLAASSGAVLCGPLAERESLDLGPTARWVDDGEVIVPGLRALALEGSKTPGELALVLEEQSLITGDLIRSHAGGALHLLPDPKLSNRTAALRSLDRLCAIETVEAVLVGDGWPVFCDGRDRLLELRARELGRDV